MEWNETKRKHNKSHLMLRYVNIPEMLELREIILTYSNFQVEWNKS